MGLINEERLFHNLMQLSKIGSTSAGGVTRLALTDKDEEGLEFIANLMRDAGLDLRRDEAGNLIGRREGILAEAASVITGSHSDTVTDGGRFDGTLGVLSAIEVLQSMNERNIATDHAIEVYVFRDEEGCRFSSSYGSSRIVTGTFDRARLSHTDVNGITMEQALKKNGINPDHLEKSQRDTRSIKAYVELHIEQGKVLEAEQCAVGIVSGICATARAKITLTGEAQHAGTTPMRLRRDPLVAAAAIIQMIEQEAIISGSAVATVGSITAIPGGVNSIPGSVEFTLDCRDISERIRDQLLTRIIRRSEAICAQRDIVFDIDVYRQSAAKPCSKAISDIIRSSCDRLGLSAITLPSGAGHDCGAFYKFCPIGMIFVRSKGGISHNPAEWSSAEDCGHGANVLYHTLLELSRATSLRGSDRMEGLTYV